MSYLCTADEGGDFLILVGLTKEKWYRQADRQVAGVKKTVENLRKRNQYLLPQTDDCEPTEIFRDHADVAATKPGRLEALQHMFDELQNAQNEEQKLQLKCVEQCGAKLIRGKGPRV